MQDDHHHEGSPVDDQIHRRIKKSNPEVLHAELLYLIIKEILEPKEGQVRPYDNQNKSNRKEGQRAMEEALLTAELFVGEV